MAVERQSFFRTVQLIRSDMQFRCDYEHKKLTLIRVLGFLTNQTVLSQVLYRFQVFFYTNYLGVFASFLKGVNSIFFTVSIDSSAKIDEGFLLLHANYICIGKNVTLGKRCILAQQNSIGPSYMAGLEDEVSDQGPVIGDDVLLGVGSAVFGNISIGSRSKVSVNTSVEKSFPEDSLLAGVPARNFAISIT